MTENVKEFAEMLIESSKNFISYDYKKHALEEISKIEKKKVFAPNIAFIVNDYPSFNSICVKLEQPNEFVFKFHINPKLIIEDEKVAYAIADMMGMWLEKGAKFITNTSEEETRQ